MKEQKDDQRFLELPALASNPNAVEVIKIWAAPRAPHQLVLRTTWKEPAAWGLILADVARHVVKAYADQGLDEHTTLDRILATFSAEIARPTSSPTRL